MPCPRWEDKFCGHHSSRRRKSCSNCGRLGRRAPTQGSVVYFARLSATVFCVLTTGRCSKHLMPCRQAWLRQLLECSDLVVLRELPRRLLTFLSFLFSEVRLALRFPSLRRPCTLPPDFFQLQRKFYDPAGHCFLGPLVYLGITVLGCCQPDGGTRAGVQGLFPFWPINQLSSSSLGICYLQASWYGEARF